MLATTMLGHGSACGSTFRNVAAAAAGNAGPVGSGGAFDGLDPVGEVGLGPGCRCDAHGIRSPLVLPERLPVRAAGSADAGDDDVREHSPPFPRSPVGPSDALPLTEHDGSLEVLSSLQAIHKREGRNAMESLDPVDRRVLELLQHDGRLTGAEVGRRVGLSQPATHAQLAPALELAAQTSGIVSTLRVTGEDCLIFDIRCADASRLEKVVDALARYGSVTTSLGLRSDETKPLEPQPQTTA